MRSFALLFLLAAAPLLGAQSIDLVHLLEPAGGPVQPGTNGLEAFQFRIYKDVGSAASNMTQVQISLSAVSGDWDTAYLYYDSNSDGKITVADQQIDSTTTGTSSLTFSGISEPIQDGYGSGRDYLVLLDIAAGATPGDTISMQLDASGVTVSAGSVSAPLGVVNGNTFTVRIDTGCEMDVQLGGNSVPSNQASSYSVGYIPTGGGTLNFTIANTGTAALQLNGGSPVTVSNQYNCTASLTGSPPSSSIAANGSTTFSVAVTPSAQVAFSFKISIDNSDFDEDPYVILCTGSALPQAEISIEYNSSEVLSGYTVMVGSYTAGLYSTLTFTIKNLGQVDLNLSGNPLVDFPAQQNVYCTLQTPPGNPIGSNGSTTFVVSFSPAGSGTWAFELAVPSDDADENPYYISVEGTAPAVTPTNLAVYRKPAGADATQAFTTQPIVSVVDGNGAVDTSNNSTVIVANITTGTGASGAALIGSTTATCVNGYATFSNLGIDTQGTGYRLTFTDQSGTLYQAVSTVFDVGPAPSGGGGGGSTSSSGGGGGGGGCSTGGNGAPWMLLCAALAGLCVAVRTLGVANAGGHGTGKGV